MSNTKGVSMSRDDERAQIVADAVRGVGPGAAAAVAKAYDSSRRRCEANARRGTGTGTCNERLDSHGQCPRVADHLSVEG